MTEKEKILNEILSETEGKIKYHEQVMQIGTDILELTLEEADHFRKAFSKLKTNDIEQYQKDMVTKLGDNDFSKQLFDQLLYEARYSKMRMILKTQELILNQTLDAILNMVGGTLKYQFQVEMIFEKILKTNFLDVELVIKGFKRKDKDLMESYFRKETNDVLKDFPNVADRIYNLLDIYADEIENVPPIFVVFNKIQK